MQAIRINPYIPEGWFDLGGLYESCNNQIGDAIDIYAQAAELDPGNGAITLMSMVRMVKVYPEAHGNRFQNGEGFSDV